MVFDGQIYVFGTRAANVYHEGSERHRTLAEATQTPSSPPRANYRIFSHMQSLSPLPHLPGDCAAVRIASTSSFVGMDGWAPGRVTETAAAAAPNRALSWGD